MASVYMQEHTALPCPCQITPTHVSLGSFGYWAELPMEGAECEPCSYHWQLRYAFDFRECKAFFLDEVHALIPAMA